MEETMHLTGYTPKTWAMSYSPSAPGRRSTTASIRWTPTSLDFDSKMLAPSPLSLGGPRWDGDFWGIFMGFQWQPRGLFQPIGAHLWPPRKGKQRNIFTSIATEFHTLVFWDVERFPAWLSEKAEWCSCTGYEGYWISMVQYQKIWILLDVDGQWRRLMITLDHDGS